MPENAPQRILWHLDFHQARVKALDQAGRWFTPVVLAILDDRSWVCCHLQDYRAETAECLVHGLAHELFRMVKAQGKGGQAQPALITLWEQWTGVRLGGK